MRHILLIVVGLFAVTGRCSVAQPDAASLAGREFSVEDDWAGQELAFQKKGEALVAVWRVLGSGRPVLLEVECPVEIKSSRCVEFDLRLRDKSRGRVKVLLGEHAEVRAFLNGIRILLEVKTADSATTTARRAASDSQLRVTDL